MKVFLSNAPWYEAGEKGFLGVRAGSRWPHKWNYNPSMRIEYRPFPFFMATASTLLKDNGFNVEFRDSIESGDTYEKYFKILKESAPDYIVMETSTPSLNNDLDVAKKIKNELPVCKLVFTGLHVEIAQEGFLEKYPWIDYTIFGEYEIPLLKLMNAVSKGGNLSDVPAITYRDGGKVKKNEREKSVPMAELPWPDRDSIPTDYYDGMNGLGEPQLQMHTSRGCPYHCNFCVWPQLVYGDHLYRMRDPQDIVNEILANLEKVEYKSIYFDDDAININKNHILELCRLIKENGIDKKVKWGCMARADLMDDEILAALKDSGCYSVKYGVETFNQEILDRTGKSMDINKNIENVKKTREKYGIKVHLTYCLGLLGDTEETVKDTIEKAMELGADSRQFSIATPYPGSVLWDIYKENGWIASDDYRLFDGNNTAVSCQGELTAKRLAELKAQAEELDRKQHAVRIPLEFMMKDRLDEIKGSVGKGRKILITCTSRRGIINELYRILTKEGNDVFVITSSEWKSSLDAVPEDRMRVLPQGSRFDADALKSDAEYYRKEIGIDTVLIPTRGIGDCGYDNVVAFAKEMTDRIIMVNEFAVVTVI